jgi:hypothetical protein
MKYWKPVPSLLLISFLFLLSCGDKNSKTQDEKNNLTELPEQKDPGESSRIREKQSNEPIMSKTEIPLDTILGRWLRPDGNYVIQINSIDSENQIDAQYFNPKPIKIARAELIPADNFRIYIEFDDEGYKGSSYDLIYDPAQDALSGKYFQATYGQTYQIAFIRLKE